MDGVRIEHLVRLGSAEIGLEHLEPVVVLLLSRIGLPEPRLEAGEVVLGAEELIVSRRRYNLADENVVVGGLLVSYGGGDRRGQEREEEEREERGTVHDLGRRIRREQSVWSGGVLNFRYYL